MTDPAPTTPTGATATGPRHAARADGPQAVRPTGGAAAPTTTPAPPGDERSIGQLVAAATRDMSTLVRSEIALAKSELKVSVRAGGVSIALFVVAGFLAVLAVVMLSVAFAHFIHMAGLHLAWGFSIVFLVYLLIAALLGFIGAKKLRGVKAPERAIHQAQETKALLQR